MLRFENLSKVYIHRGVKTVIARDVCLDLPERKSIALLGRNGAGKSSLLRMIAGTMDPTSGRVVPNGRVSWPVGFAGYFHPDLSGAQNTRFVARVYGVDSDDLIGYVQDFAELGRHFNLPFSTYSAGMRSRLAFGVSMGIDFDTYLVDEVTSVGDAAFRSKSEKVFQDRMLTRSAIVVSHAMDVIRKLCDEAMVLEGGELTYYSDLEQAIAVHRKNLGH